ncbi:MAG TPA: hypothetical protein DEP66_00735, partial [Acidimicrobiaceae bacterium]|nr:hypothetical protein [Acidimicrobiaceae bacterium]HCB36770.1 hypothetical protein [Acidimicrobiaceae bacterium]
AAAGCLFGAFGVVLSRNAVHAALMLVMTLFGVAVLFVSRDAHFLAAVQVIVYAGAVVVLFLFVIMLLGVGRSGSLQISSLRFQPWAALAFAVGALVVVAGVVALVANPATGERSVGGVLPASADPLADAGITGIAHSLFSDYLYAFELTSLLLVVAVIGTVVLTRRGTDDPPASPAAPAEPAAPAAR